MNKEKIKNLLRAKRILTPTPNSHRLVSAAGTGLPTRTFTSDNAGNITLDDRGAGNTVTITIGADGRPQTVVVAGTGATSVAYKHNALGERVSRVEGGTTTHFHYDLDGTLIAESDGAGIVIREYLWLGTKPVGLVVGPAGSPTLYYVHADHLDRVQKITDGTQAIVWDGQFTPYGRTHAIAGTVTNPLRFPGQWADPAAGYFYNYMRDYDPTLARYLSVDPLGTGGGRNKFSYAGANPQNLIDRLGEQTSNIRPNQSSATYRAQASFNIPYSIRNSHYASSMWLYNQIRQYNANFKFIQPSSPEHFSPQLVENLRQTLRNLERDNPAGPLACSQPVNPLPNSNIEAAAASIIAWLGPGYRSVSTPLGNRQFISADGTKIIRFDLQGYANPHINLQTMRPTGVNGRMQSIGNIHFDNFKK